MRPDFLPFPVMQHAHRPGARPRHRDQYPLTYINNSDAHSVRNFFAQCPGETSSTHLRKHTVASAHLFQNQQGGLCMVHPLSTVLLDTVARLLNSVWTGQIRPFILPLLTHPFPQEPVMYGPGRYRATSAQSVVVLDQSRSHFSRLQQSAVIILRQPPR